MISFWKSVSLIIPSQTCAHKSSLSAARQGFIPTNRRDGEEARREAVDVRAFDIDCLAIVINQSIGHALLYKL